MTATAVVAPTKIAPAPSDEVLVLLEHAAELKAAGNTWVAIGVVLQRDERSLRRWKAQYPELWNRLLSAACDDSIQRLSGMASTGLSKLVNAKDDKERWRGCQFVYGKWIQLLQTKMKLQAQLPAGQGLNPFWQQAIQDIDAQTEEQINQEIIRYADILRTNQRELSPVDEQSDLLAVIDDPATAPSVAAAPSPA